MIGCHGNKMTGCHHFARHVYISCLPVFLSCTRNFCSSWFTHFSSFSAVPVPSALSGRVKDLLWEPVVPSLNHLLTFANNPHQLLLSGGKSVCVWINNCHRSVLSDRWAKGVTLRAVGSTSSSPSITAAHLRHAHTLFSTLLRVPWSFTKWRLTFQPISFLHCCSILLLARRGRQLSNNQDLTS